LNEDQYGFPFPKKEVMNKAVKKYYHEGVLECRKYLADSTPIVLFSNVFDLQHWKGNDYPESKYGLIQWDTHSY
jgi:hypothetical protein